MDSAWLRLLEVRPSQDIKHRFYSFRYLDCYGDLGWTTLPISFSGFTAIKRMMLWELRIWSPHLISDCGLWLRHFSRFCFTLVTSSLAPVCLICFGSDCALVAASLWYQVNIPRCAQIESHLSHQGWGFHPHSDNSYKRSGSYPVLPFT